MDIHVESENEAESAQVLDWFGLRETPFAPDPDVRFYYPLPHQERAVDHCIRAVVSQAGMPLVYGPDGTGKSIVGARLRSRLEGGVANLAFQTYVIDGGTHFRSSTPALRELSLALGGRKTVPNYRLYDEIESCTTKLLASGTCVVVLLERAERFQDDMMRMVLFLWNLVTRDGSQFLVRLVALGGPAYLRTLEKYKYANIRSRTVFGAPALRALEPEELAALVRHRLTVAGGREDVFSADAIEALNRVSEGNPRRALDAASRALAAAFVRRLPSVDADSVPKMELG